MESTNSDRRTVAGRPSLAAGTTPTQSSVRLSPRARRPRKITAVSRRGHDALAKFRPSPAAGTTPSQNYGRLSPRARRPRKIPAVPRRGHDALAKFQPSLAAGGRHASFSFGHFPFSGVVVSK